MPGENLTRVEAQERRATVNVHLYDVTLDLTTGDETFRSTTVVTFDAAPGSSTFIDAITRRVHRVELNGRELDPAEVSDGVRIRLEGLEAQNRLVVDADAVYMNTGEGMHRFVDPVDGEVYLYTQFEVPDARRVFAVFEQPDLKAQFVFHVTGPKHWRIISNQPATDPVPVGGDAATWHFMPTPRISSYVTAIVAGPYVSEHDSLVSVDGRTIPLGVYCRASVAEHLDAENIFDTTKRGFAYYEHHFNGPYPFDKYDQLFVPEFNAGAMENVGCVTFTETYVFRSKVQDAVRERRDVTILHELAHMWFGDLVTMRWWNDLWLNESFAEFMSTIACAEATQWTEAWTTFNAMEKSWAYRQDQLPSTHPIVADIRDLDDVLVNFDGITYAKGGSVLKQLFFWVGREAFFRGVSTYFRKHGWANTELRDLLAELEEASGRDLTGWSRLWLETAGVNALRPLIQVDESGVITSFAVEQTATAEHPTLRPHRLAIGFYDLQAPQDPRESGVLRRTDRIELDIDGPTTAVPELVGRPRPDLLLLNDDDLAYAKIRLDEASLRIAVEHVASIESPLARSLVLGSVWDSTRDAETRPRDFIRLVLGSIGCETESTTRRTVLGQLATAAKFYTDPDDRAEIVEVVTDELWALADAAEPGSDAQFGLVKSFASLAHSPAHLDVLDELFQRDRALDGLEIDTDLGWELLIALVAGGRRTQADIDWRLGEDNTADGQRAAAHAAAAIPTPEGKEAAWQRVMVETDAPNAVVRATAAGFSRGDDDLLAPYVGRYFEAIRGVWDARSFHIAEELIEGFFPSHLPTPAVREAATAWLDANTDAPDALRRLIVEGRAAVERSIGAQRRDADAGE